MTKAVELENLLSDFADELTDEEMEEIARYFENTTIVKALQEALEDR